MVNANALSAAANATMLAVIWNGHPNNMSVERVPKPTIQNSTDVVVKISTAAICGTDIHVYHGLYGSQNPGWGMGHEGVGYVEQAGDGVRNHKVGDYVIVPDNWGTGQYPNVDTFTQLTPGYGPNLTANQNFGGTQGELASIL